MATKVSKVDWLNDHLIATTRLTDVAHELLFLARAFGATGNEDMRRKLAALADEVREATEAANTALTQSINESCKRSHDSMVQTVGLAFDHLFSHVEPDA